jgi:predicted dehydrogenase
VRTYTATDSVYEAESIDFIDICTPPHTHFPVAAEAARRGVHVLCEKPLVLTAADGRALAELAREHDVEIACVHNWTQAPILARLGALARSGELGDVVELELETLRTQPAAVATAPGDTSNWRTDPARAGGGVLYDHGWHGMSIILRTLGARPERVQGMIEKRRHHDLPVEDTAESRITLAGGKRARFFATWAADNRANRGRLVCERGTVELANDVLRITGDGRQVGEERFEESLAQGGYRPAWTAGIAREFASAVRDPAARGRALDEALTCQRLVLATYASAAQGGQPTAV